MQKKTGIITLILFLLLPVTGSATTAVPGTERVETARGSVFYYTIQKGDTLWDLSRKFYNSQRVWPGLWEMNHQIQNPHLIYPGNRITVFLADSMEPEPILSPHPPENSEPSATKHSPVSRTQRISIENSDFIKERPEPSLGHVLMAENKRTLLAEGDTLFITPVEKNPFVPGSQYHIFSTEKVALKYDKTQFKGVKHTIKATVTILESSDACIRAVITRAFRASAPGDPLMAHRPLQEEITVNPRPRPIQARIICSQYDNELLAEGSIAFMDAGSQKHVQPGDIYTLYKNQTAPSKGFLQKASPLPLLKTGTLMVLHTEAISATVKILDSTTEVLSGDVVR